MEAVADDGITVILSSHIVAELERVCDHLVILAAGGVQLAGPIEELLRSHQVLTGPRGDAGAVAARTPSSRSATPRGRRRCSCAVTAQSPIHPGASTRSLSRRSSSRTWDSRPNARHPRARWSWRRDLVTWRQQRTEALIAALLLALVAALIVPTGLHMASCTTVTGLHASRSSPMRRQTLVLPSRWDSLMNFVGWLNLVPVLLRGVDRRTPRARVRARDLPARLTQSVSRDRWLATRLPRCGGFTRGGIGLRAADDVVA